MIYYITPPFNEKYRLENPIISSVHRLGELDKIQEVTNQGNIFTISKKLALLKNADSRPSEK